MSINKLSHLYGSVLLGGCNGDLDTQLVWYSNNGSYCCQMDLNTRVQVNFLSIISGFLQNIFMFFQKFCQIIFIGKNFPKTENFNRKQIFSGFGFYRIKPRFLVSGNQIVKTVLTFIFKKILTFLP